MDDLRDTLVAETKISRQIDEQFTLSMALANQLIAMYLGGIHSYSTLMSVGEQATEHVKSGNFHMKA